MSEPNALVYVLTDEQSARKADREAKVRDDIARAACPDGLPERWHEKLIEKCGVLALAVILLNRGYFLDRMAQLADCQENPYFNWQVFRLIHFFLDHGENRNGLSKDDLIEKFSDFFHVHRLDKRNPNDFRFEKDVLGKKWDDDLVAFCERFRRIYPTEYKINALNYLLRIDVTIFHDGGGAIINWATRYEHYVYNDDDTDKDKKDVVLWSQRPYLRELSSRLLRKYNLDRLLTYCSKEYSSTSADEREGPFNSFYDQLHFVNSELTSVVKQINKAGVQIGPDIIVGAAFPQILKMYVMCFVENIPINFLFRRRSMKILPGEATKDDEGQRIPYLDEESEDQSPNQPMDYNTTGLFHLRAIPNKELGDFRFAETWDKDTNDDPLPVMECISYRMDGPYNNDSDDFTNFTNETYKQELLKKDTSPLAACTPMMALHETFPGRADRISPGLPLYKQASPEYPELPRPAYKRLSIDRLNLNPNPSSTPASINEMMNHGRYWGQERGYYDTRDCVTFLAGNNKVLSLRTLPLDVAPRHILSCSSNNIYERIRKIEAIQEEKENKSAIHGRHLFRYSAGAVPCHDAATAQSFAGKKTKKRAAEYLKAYPQNKMYVNLANKEGHWDD